MSTTRTRTPTRPASSVAIQIAVAARGIPSRARLRRWALVAASGRTELTLRIVGATEARSLNRSYRKRDYATDVLTFVYARSPRRGDIVLCHSVLARAARERGIALDAHYAHLVVHGMLHLRGYDHTRARDASRMERMETRLLAAIGYADPYAVESGPSSR